MPYRFKFTESAGKSFRRIAAEQCGVVKASLSDHDSATSLHAARKALKRVRALIAASRPALGPKQARAFDRDIRDVSRMLAPRRDADVALQTLTKLELLGNAEAESALANLRAALTRPVPAADDGVADATHILAADTLEGVSKRLSRVRFEGRGMAAVFGGMEDVYRAGRAALKTALRAPTDDNFHDLRKQVQLHWRHMALISRAWPEAFAVRVAEARAISQALGDDHDYAVLKQKAAEALSDIDCATIVAMCDRQQADLRAPVRWRIERLYADKPSQFAAMLAVTWKSGRHLKPRAVAAVQHDASSAPRLQTAKRAQSASTKIGSPADIAAKSRGKAPSQDGS